MAEFKVYIFWDNSNIFIEGQKLADTRDGPGERYALRILFDNLYRLAHAGRQVAGGVVGGSIPPEHEEIWARFQADTPNLEFDIQERGALSGKEQGVDYALRYAMLQALTDNQEPQIAVVMTGDGSGYEEGKGFHADLERLHKNGWGIEVLAWERSCKRRLKEWAEKAGVFIPLENFYESITFINGGRHGKPLTLTRRPKSTPRTLASGPEDRKQEAKDRKEKLKERRRKKHARKAQQAAQNPRSKKKK